MNKPNVRRLFKTAKVSAKKNSPIIWVTVGVAGMFVAAGLAVKATPKAIKQIEEKKDEINKELFEEAKANEQEDCEQISKLKPVDVVKTTWKGYIPAVALGVTSALCVFKGNSIHIQRSAGLATAYQLTENAYHEYRERMKAVVGEEKEREVRTKVAEKVMGDAPVPANKEVMIDGGGTGLYFDYSSGRYFRSDPKTVDNAMIKLRNEMELNSYISLNEFYEAIGLPTTSLGALLGWNIFNQGRLLLETSARIAKNGEACVDIEFVQPPVYDFWKFD